MIKRQGVLFALVGPAGVGKTTLSQQLLKDYSKNMRLSISVTTRAPRAGETDGISYYFVTEDDFKKKISAGEFFEHEQVHGNYYGTLKATVLDAINTGMNLLLDIDIAGALNFKRNFPGNTVNIFLVPPSFSELKRRLVARGIKPEDLAKRMNTAKKEYQALLDISATGQVDYLLLNDNYDQTYAQLKAIVEAEFLRLGRIDESDLNRLCVIE